MVADSMQSCVMRPESCPTVCMLLYIVVDHQSQYWQPLQQCCKPVMALYSLCITEGVDSFVNSDLFQYNIMCIDNFVRLYFRQNIKFWFYSRF